MFKGVYTAIVTPFNSDGSVDYGCLKDLIDRQAAAGIDGIVHFELEGCLALNNIARVTGERAEKEIGVKNFYAVDVHCQDMERFNELEFEEAIWNVNEELKSDLNRDEDLVRDTRLQVGSAFSGQERGAHNQRQQRYGSKPVCHL